MLQANQIAERWCERSRSCVQISWSEIPLTEAFEAAGEVARYPLECTGRKTGNCPVTSPDSSQWHLCSVWNRLVKDLQRGRELE
jgi:hypothetical protein